MTLQPLGRSFSASTTKAGHLPIGPASRSSTRAKSRQRARLTITSASLAESLCYRHRFNRSEKLNVTTIQSKRQATAKKNTNGRAIGGVASMNAYVKSIADIMRCSGRAGALQYVPEMTWMIFLRVLDEREQREAAE